MFLSKNQELKILQDFHFCVVAHMLSEDNKFYPPVENALKFNKTYMISSSNAISIPHKELKKCGFSLVRKKPFNGIYDIYFNKDDVKKLFIFMKLS